MEISYAHIWILCVSLPYCILACMSLLYHQAVEDQSTCRRKSKILAGFINISLYSFTLTFLFLLFSQRVESYPPVVSGSYFGNGQGFMVLSNFYTITLPRNFIIQLFLFSSINKCRLCYNIVVIIIFDNLQKRVQIRFDVINALGCPNS